MQCDFDLDSYIFFFFNSFFYFRAQTIQLLQKLHRAKVFEDVRGSKHNRGDFADNARLFRY